MKLFNRLIVYGALLFGMTLASCDDDVTKSVRISGEWEGDFGMCYDVENPHTGRMERFDATYSYLYFMPHHDYATYGTGKQVDFYNYGPYSKQYYYFRWEISDGHIYMSYPANRNLSVVIDDYRLTHSRFTGYINGSRFDLDKLTDYYQWDSYTGDYRYYDNGSWTWDGYYNVKSRAFVDDDSKVVLRNRFMEGEGK